MFDEEEKLYEPSLSLGGGMYDPYWTPERIRTMHAVESKTIDEDINEGTRFLGARRYLDSTTDEAVSETVREAIAWWHQAGPKPKRSSFDIIDHPKWAPMVYLVKCLDPCKFEYRLAGEEVIRIVGRNDTKRVFTPDHENAYDREFAQYLEHVCASEKPWICRGAAIMETGVRVPFESVDMPLFNDSGSVGWISGIIEPIVTDDRWSVPVERQTGPID